jgi:type I site-specific restriction-modification system R (restriction) subunit
MAYSDINSEDRLVQQTFAEHLEKKLGWESLYAWNHETFGPEGTLGRADAREVVLTRDLRAALTKLNPGLPASAIDEAVQTFTRRDFSRSLIQHNQELHGFLRNGVPVSYRDGQGPMRMDYYRKYSEIIADYNREKDRVAIEDTFAKLVDLVNGLSTEQRRAAEEGLDEETLALFDLLKKEDLSKPEREGLKIASKSLLNELRKLIAPLDKWTDKEQTRAEVEIFILDHVFRDLPTPPFSEEEKQAAAARAYQHIWSQSTSGRFPRKAA